MLLVILEGWRESAAAAFSTHRGRRNVATRAMFAIGSRRKRRRDRMGTSKEDRKMVMHGQLYGICRQVLVGRTQ